VIVGALPAACVTPEVLPQQPFVGAWATPERQQIAFRQDTVVLSPPNEPPTPMSAATCEGRFRFGYARRSREAILGLIGRQPDMRARLAQMLAQPEYMVAEAQCGEGDTTYVLLDDRDAVAIHRDNGITGIERLSRV
jgi:hypothetical protein